MTQRNIAPLQEAPQPIDPGVRIGHVHLRTAGDLDLDLDDLLAEPEPSATR